MDMLWLHHQISHLFLGWSTDRWRMWAPTKIHILLMNIVFAYIAYILGYFSEKEKLNIEKSSVIIMKSHSTQICDQYHSIIHFMVFLKA